MSHRHDYAYMDHAGPGGFPWANRLVSDRVRPLPADIGWLRRTYPASGTVYDVSVLNTWHEDGSEPDADDQVALCKPSTGTDWSDDIGGSGSAQFCGKDAGAGDSCPIVGPPTRAGRTTVSPAPAARTAVLAGRAEIGRVFAGNGTGRMAGRTKLVDMVAASAGKKGEIRANSFG